MAIYQDKLTPFGAKSEPAFITSGFKNWKKACEKFKAHENSHTHCHAVSVTAQESHPINAQLSSALATQQGDNRHCLEKIVSSIKYLVRQGQALRGHDDDDSNLYQLLKNLAEDDALLAKWLLRSQKEYLSPQIQNEILCSMSNSIVSEIADTIRNLPIFEFAIIMDGTQDISGKEQESICLRYIDSDMKPHEEFIGLYSVSETTGKSLAAVVKDVLLRLNLPMHGLRGQTYDGAANMSGKHAGAQALIKQEQPLALFVHCGAHCTNLIAQKACLASVLIRDALDWVNQLGVLFSQSGKFKAIHAATAHTENPSCTAIKPLCPTRWAVRSKAIRDVLSQYGSVLASLQEMASGASNTASTANGLLGQFRKGKTVLGLILASPVIDELECLSISFQKRTQTIAGMRTAVKVVQTSLKAKRNQESFNTLLKRRWLRVGETPLAGEPRRLEKECSRLERDVEEGSRRLAMAHNEIRHLKDELESAQNWNSPGSSSFSSRIRPSSDPHHPTEKALVSSSNPLLMDDINYPIISVGNLPQEILQQPSWIIAPTTTKKNLNATW
ncbi:zinc finger MYM-type protein 1-like [Xiphophorus hellerii]|uniref:zinc finger MYM-type protein 1-like n=1 Tax=Xiphophorus hellerii TaxID=8084 RepID=UPI0013B3E813|nr:zinc finger MYM-type protein 1-like [Xiphophorus hellerii]